MFSTKIYLLSVIVVCLFSLGQAAPVIDDVSSLSTRELTSLDARGIFDFLFHRKLDKITQKVVDDLSINTECRLYSISTKLVKKFKAAQKSIAGMESDATSKASTKGKKDAKKAYKKAIKEFGDLATKAGKKAEKHMEKLKKLGVINFATQCHSSHSATSSTETHSTETHSETHSESSPHHTSSSSSES